MLNKLIPKKLKRIINILKGIELTQPLHIHHYKLNIEDINRYEGMTILVTGGTGAIGSAICYALAACGATIGMCGRSEDKIRSTIKNIEETSPSVAKMIVPVILDVNNEEQIKTAIDDFVFYHKKIDVLINNAGGQPGRVGDQAKTLYESEISQIDLILNTNLRGSILCSRVAAQHMVLQKCGSIINMGSVVGIGGKSGMCDYAAAKSGIIGFTKSLALELGKFGIRVNCISPGFVNQVPFDSGSSIQSTTKNVLGRHGFTREVADMVCYLVHDKYITGQNIVVDGGRSIGLYGDVENKGG